MSENTRARLNTYASYLLAVLIAGLLVGMAALTVKMMLNGV